MEREYSRALRCLRILRTLQNAMGPPSREVQLRRIQNSVTITLRFTKALKLYDQAVHENLRDQRHHSPLVETKLVPSETSS